MGEIWGENHQHWIVDQLGCQLGKTGLFPGKL